MKRSQNQDNFLVAPDLNLFVVADGMGGHKGGETASQLAVSAIGDYFRAMTAAKNLANENPAQKLRNALMAANSSIQRRGESDVSLQGMGTTTVVAYFADGKLYLGHVGDSRCYLVTQNAIWQLTRDHSLVQEKLRAGLITRDQVKTDRMRNVITRSVGFERDVDIDIYEIEPHPSDVYVICSDGLSGMVEDQGIRAIIDECVYKSAESGSPKAVETAAHRLIEAANSNGGDDNVTAILVQII